jgi:hypothetical protein
MTDFRLQIGRLFSLACTSGWCTGITSCLTMLLRLTTINTRVERNRGERLGQR